MTEKQVTESIRSYWSIKPPFKAAEGAEPGTLEWYQGITKHRYTVASHVKDHLKFESFKGKKILEIGCGAGTDLCEFARNGAEIIGVDITETAVELTEKRLKTEGLQGSAQVYNGRKLPFADGSFDYVYSWGVLHHTPWMEDVFSDVHRVLKPGGTMTLMLYHRHSLLYYYSILYLRREQGTWGHLSRDEALSRFSEFREECPYTRVFSEEEMKEILWYFNNVDTAVDYCVYDTENERKIPATKVMEVEKTGVPDIDIFFERFNSAVKKGEDLKRFGWHLIVHARK